MGATVSLRKQAATVRRVDALFKAMSTDFLLREQFVTEPAQLLAEYVHGKKLDEDAADAADQFIYSVMASPELLQWFQGYAAQHQGRRPAPAQLVKDFSQAVTDTNSRHVVLALARGSLEPHSVFELEIDFLNVLFDAVAGLGGRVSHTEMSTGHTTATEMSTGHVFHTEMSTGHTTATEMSTGHVFSTEMSTGHTTATEMSTGHVFSTEMSTGHTTATEMSTGHVFSTEMSTGHTTATEMSTGHVFSTEMSTGHTTATEMSTGHVFHTEMSTGHTTATEMSTGHVFHTEMSTGHSTATQMSTGHGFDFDLGALRGGFHRATFAALAEYALELRARGALDVVWR